MTDVFVNAAALETVLLMVAGAIEGRSVRELEALESLWAALVPPDEAARWAVEGCRDVQRFSGDESDWP